MTDPESTPSPAQVSPVPDVSVQAFLLCSAFNVNERQLNILGGGLQLVAVDRFPSQFPLGLVVGCTLPNRPGNPVSVRIEVRLGMDGHLVLPPLVVDLDSSTDFPDESWSGGATIHLPIDLSPFLVEEPGDYWFGLYVDDRLVTSTILAVVEG